MSKRGFLSVEAAIFLPVFLIAMLSLICLIRVIGVEENVMHIFSSEARKVSKEAYVSQLEMIPDGVAAEALEGLIHKSVLQQRLRNQIETAEGKRISNLDLVRFWYLHEDRGLSGIISMNLSFQTEIPLPIGFHRSLDFEEQLVFRGFIGASGDYEPMEYYRMEQEEDSEIVYVFPRAGEKFHRRECRVIVVYPEEVFLSPAIKRNIPLVAYVTQRMFLTGVRFTASRIQERPIIKAAALL
jgi:hypothetical protein